MVGADGVGDAGKAVSGEAGGELALYLPHQFGSAVDQGAIELYQAGTGAHLQIGVRTGGDAAENAAILQSILNGEPGPRRDIVVANAAAALVAAGQATDFKTGAVAAAESIDSGKAREKLNELVRFTAGCAAT